MQASLGLGILHCNRCKGTAQAPSGLLCESLARLRCSRRVTPTCGRRCSISMGSADRAIPWSNTLNNRFVLHRRTRTICGRRCGSPVRC